MKKKTRTAMALFLLIGALMVNFVTVQAAEPRYTGVSRISSTLNISNRGAASCYGQAIVRSGYKADLTVELQRDGTTIKTWTSSGSGTVSAEGIYYVTSGHDYVVVTTATVYDNAGNYIESPSGSSPQQSY